MDKNRYYSITFPTDMVPDFPTPPLASIPVPRDSKMFESICFLKIFNLCLFFFDNFFLFFAVDHDCMLRAEMKNATYWELSKDANTPLSNRGGSEGRNVGSTGSSLKTQVSCSERLR